MNYLKSIIVDLLGQYEPVVTTLQNGDEIVQYDINFIVSAVVFCILLWSLLRIIGGLICNR